MRIRAVEKLKPGDVVARSVVDSKGQVLLHAGVALTQRYISALAAKGFGAIYVKDPECPVDVVPEEDLSPALRAKATRSLKQVFDVVGAHVGALRQRSFNELKKACVSDEMRALTGRDGPLANIQEVVGDVISECLSRNTLAGLVSIRSADDALFAHSLDVCVVALMIARAAGESNLRLRQLATGCLLHDLGKVFLDPKERETTRIRQHTTLGFELLRNGYDPDILAPHVALEHH